MSLLITPASSHTQSPLVESDTFLSGHSPTVFATSILNMPFDASLVCYILLWCISRRVWSKTNRVTICKMKTQKEVALHMR